MKVLRDIGTDLSELYLRVMSVSHEATKSPAGQGLYTADEVAKMLRVCPRTVRRWGEAGVLKQINLGPRLRRYTSTSVEELLRPHEHMPSCEVTNRGEES